MPPECVKAMSSELFQIRPTKSNVNTLDGHVVTGSADIEIIKITHVTKLQVFLMYSN